MWKLEEENKIQTKKPHDVYIVELLIFYLVPSIDGIFAFREAREDFPESAVSSLSTSASA